MSQVIDGKIAAANLNHITKTQVEHLKAFKNVQPGLAVVLVGSDPASHVYVRNKIHQAEASGILSIEKRFDATVSTEQLLSAIDQLNADPNVHGILVQLPLPSSIDAPKVIARIAAEKDVDGFHVTNTGQLMSGEGRPLLPCTPQGCVILAKQYGGSDLSGKHAVVVGRSNIVGKPLAILLLQENCTVTIAHSRTADLPAICRQADLLFVAVGRPEFVKADWVKPGAMVIDVGINRVDSPDGRSRLVGDVDYPATRGVASAITPVPGGVGPMTIACLLKNTVEAACNQHGIPIP